MRLLLASVLFTATAGCGLATSKLQSGSYTIASGFEPSGASLAVDVAAKRATLKTPGQSDTTLELTALPEASWLRGCQTNFSSVLLETFSVSPSPLVLGSLTLMQPRLSAGCGLDKANDNELSLSGGTTSVLFRR